MDGRLVAFVLLLCFILMLVVQHFANHEGIDIDQLQLPNSPIHVVRAAGVLKNVDVHKMFESFANGGLEERQKVSPDILVGFFIQYVENECVFNGYILAT